MNISFPKGDRELFMSYETEHPCEYSGWKLLSFNQRHCNFVHPAHFGLGPMNQHGEVECDDAEVQRGLDEGLAFLVSCYMHSAEQWGLRGEVHQCRWDTAQIAGILIWNDDDKDAPVEKPEREASARAFLEEYTNWVNGYVPEEAEGT